PPKMANSPVQKAISAFVGRGGNVQLLTEITKENLSSVKELMKTQEIRHIDGLNLNFGISDNMFSAPTSIYSVTSEPQCIWSTSKDLIKQHQYLFDNLWAQAIPAKARISQLEEGIEPEITEVITGWDGIFKNAVGVFQNATIKVDSCCDSLVPPIIINSPMNQASADFVKR